MFQAYDSNSALREMVGIRGAAPSIRFNESVPGVSSSKEVLHVPANESVYVWGVELFSAGHDCIKITHYPENSPPFLIKDGGSHISNFKNQKTITYVKNEISIKEEVPFDDFWQEPYLVNKNDEQIIKSNFFRCFIFLEEGYYKIEIDESFNPKYMDPNFLPIDYSSDEIYSPGSGDRSVRRAATWQVKKSKSNTVNESYARSNSFLKREIYVRAISRTKDIVDGSSFTRNVFNLSPGMVKYENLPPFTPSTNLDTNGNPVRLDLVGPWHLLGNNSYYNIDTYHNSNTTTSGAPTIDTTHGWQGRHAVIAPRYTMSSFMNQFLENTYRPYSDYFRQGCRYVNMRNGIMENINFYGSDYTIVHQFMIVPSSYYNDYLTVSASEASQYLSTTSYVVTINNIDNVVTIDSIDNVVAYLNNGTSTPSSSTNPLSVPDQYNNNVLLDMRGCVFKNCTFDKYNIGWSFRKDTMLDGAVFENCTFIGAGLGYLHYGGVLIKNCHFEEISSNSDLSLSWDAGGSCCVMGCTQKYTERGTLFSFHKGGFNDSVWIRNSLHGIDRFQIANEHWVCESCCCGDCEISNRFDNNMYIMNRASKGPASIGPYRTNSKLNLMAFNSFESPSGGAGMIIVNDPGRAFDMECNVWLYNDILGGYVDFQNWCKNNRLINCTFRKAQNTGNPWGGYNWVAQDEQSGCCMYSSYKFLNISGTTTNAPQSNLLINCSMIDYQDDSYTFGASYASDNNWFFSNKDPKIDNSELLAGKNVIYNLRRIIENSMSRKYPFGESVPGPS